MMEKKVMYIVVVALVISAICNDRVQASSDLSPHPYPNPRYASLVDHAHNLFVDPEKRLIPLIQKLKRIKEGGDEVVSIVHIGDSHVQAGFIDEWLRHYFQSDFGDAGAGLVVPLKLIRTNQPLHYTITSPNRWSGSTCLKNEQEHAVGLSAMSISTPDPYITFNITATQPFSMIRAFHHPSAPQLKASFELMDPSVLWQDTIPAVTTIPLNRSVTDVTLTASATEDQNQHTYYGFSLETGHPGVLVHAIGINGAAFAHYNNHPHILSQIEALHPDLVVVALGTNDTFGNNYVASMVHSQIERFTESFTAVQPDVPMLFVTPMESCRSRVVKRTRTYTVNPNIVTTGNLIIKTAQESSMPYWNLYKAAGGAGSNKRWTDKGLMGKDRLHLKAEGYALQADMFYEAFVTYYNSSL